MRRIHLCLLLLLAAIGAHAQLLWKISGNGLEKPSYLFGTHHFAPVEFVDSVPGLSSALKSVDNLCGEIVLDEMQSPATVQALQQAVALPGDTTLQLLFTPDEYREVLAKIKELMGVDAAQLNGIKPAFLVNQLNLLFALKSWVYRISFNTCISYERKNKRLTFVPIAPELNMCEDDTSTHKQIQALYARISRLEPFDRAIILLWLEAMPYQEIAEIVGISVKNVSVRLSRIREQLKSMKG